MDNLSAGSGRIARGLLGMVLALVVALSGWSAALGQDDELPPPRRVPPGERDKDKYSPGQPILSPDYPEGPVVGIPVTFHDVLLLANQANLDIARANIVVERARAQLLRVRSRYLPNLSLGSTYVAHDGQIQRTEGTVVTANRDSLFVGLGPSLSFNLADALFLPEEATRLLDAATVGQVRVSNDTLLRVGDAYFAVLRARRRLARMDEVMEFLTSEKESDLRGGSKGLLPIIRAFVKTGNALPSDQARVEADVVRRQEERVRAMEDLRTSSAELCRLLHLNAVYFLLPGEDYRWPLRMPGDAWACCPVEKLVAQALRSRPELAENHAFLEAAMARYRSAKWRPLMPNVVLNYSWGGFGGGPQVIGRTRTGANILSNSGTIQDFDTRSDFEVGLVWRLEGLGLGNRAQQLDAKLRIEDRQLQQLQLQDTVVSQVVQSLEQVQRGRQRVQIAQAGLFDEEGRPNGTVYRSLKLNFQRIKAGLGLPLEVLDSTRRHSDVLESYVVSLSDYDRARFRLTVALGFPPGALLDPRLMPLPDCAGGEHARPDGYESGHPIPVPVDWKQEAKQDDRRREIDLDKDGKIRDNDKNDGVGVVPRQQGLQVHRGSMPEAPVPFSPPAGQELKGQLLPPISDSSPSRQLPQRRK